MRSARPVNVKKHVNLARRHEVTTTTPLRSTATLPALRALSLKNFLPYVNREMHWDSRLRRLDRLETSYMSGTSKRVGVHLSPLGGTRLSSSLPAIFHTVSPLQRQHQLALTRKTTIARPALRAPVRRYP